MDFFDELGEKIVSTGKYAGEKAKEAADVAKLNTQLAQEEYKLRKAYYELGKFYYENGDIEESYIEPYISAVRDKNAVIESIKEQIESIKNK